MPILVQLITESGEQVAAVNDVDGFISSCASEPRKWRLLKYVDPYGDTYFNRLQILDFLADWEAAETLVRSPEGETLWVEVGRLARRWREEVHLYLKFSLTDRAEERGLGQCSGMTPSGRDSEAMSR